MKVVPLVRGPDVRLVPVAAAKAAVLNVFNLKKSSEKKQIYIVVQCYLSFFDLGGRVGFDLPLKFVL